MFRTPYPKSILSTRQVEEMEDKLCRLGELRKHPRSEHTEMKVAFDQLEQCIEWLLKCADYPSTVETRSWINVAIRKSYDLENTIIQVVIQGKDYAEVVGHSK